MKILLDTQVFIWLINDDKRLGSSCRSLLLSTTNELFVSYLSLFEISIKASLGKIKFDVSIWQDFEAMKIALLFGGQEELASYQVFNSRNKDPFDNFLIATAKVYKYALATSDEKIISTKIRGLKILNALE